MALFGANTGMCMAETSERTNLAFEAEMPGRSRAAWSAKNHVGANIAKRHLGASVICVTGGAVAPPGNDRVPHRTASV
jgi:hypothetical protein